MTLTLGILANVLACLAIVLGMRKVWWAPIFGLAVQPLWLLWIALTGAWPLLLTTVFLAVTYAVAIPKWRRERQRGGSPALV